LQRIREQQQKHLPKIAALAIKYFDNLFGKRLDVGQIFTIASILRDDNEADFSLSLPSRRFKNRIRQTKIGHH
jgi:hypothetical protein